jgi:hypothetical protein
MSQPTLLGKLFSPAGFGLVLLLFFLPFVAVSCGPAEHRVTATYSGLDMVVGNAPYFSGPDIRPDDQTNVSALFQDQYTNEPLALTAAVIVFVAMGAALLNQRRLRHFGAITAAAVAAALLLAGEIRSIDRLNHVQLRDNTGQITDLSPVNAQPRIGFYLAMAILLALVVGHAIALSRPPPATAARDVHAPPDELAHAAATTEEAWRPPPIWAQRQPEDDTLTEDDVTEDAATQGTTDEWSDETWPARPE